MPTKPSIVFAHGLWADGSCFQKLIHKLTLRQPEYKQPGIAHST